MSVTGRIAIIAAVWVIGVIICAACARTLYLALRRCAPENRAMSPRLVWIVAIPYLHLPALPFVAAGVSRSLSAELRSRGWSYDPRVPLSWHGQLLSFGFLVGYVVQLLGLLYPESPAIFRWSSLITVIFLAFLFTAMTYWSKVARLSARLAGTDVAAAA